MYKYIVDGNWKLYDGLSLDNCTEAQKIGVLKKTFIEPVTSIIHSVFVDAKEKKAYTFG